jgi:hypothetical protein
MRRRRPVLAAALISEAAEIEERENREEMLREEMLLINPIFEETHYNELRLIPRASVEIRGRS